MEKRKNKEEQRTRNIFRSTQIIHQSQHYIFYGASEYILGRLAGHALNVSMDAFMYSSSLLFLLFCCFCWWLSNPPRHETRRYSNALGNAVLSGFTTPTVGLAFRLTVQMAFC
jgi:hypothetical protein